MLESKEGHKVPDVEFRARHAHEWIDLSSSELFGGKTVIVFSLPGAFTPTCSSSHVPRYDQLAKEFHRHGVDEIICISVNDAFVMNEWQEHQQAWNIRFLPDGNGEFTDRMGMLVDKKDLGFGRRSWRYSMLVRDGVVEKMFVEPELEGDPYEVSDADTMLGYIAPAAHKPAEATIFSRKGCAHCVRAKLALDHAEIGYEELILNRDFTDRSLRAVTGRTTFPQVFINGKLVGGADELETWIKGRKAA